MITQYQIVQDVNIQLLAQKVGQFIELGWQPLGGVSTTNVKLDLSTDKPNNNGNEHLHYAQALVK